jgi:VanZ family protein
VWVFRVLALLVAVGLLVIIWAANTDSADWFFDWVKATPYADKVGHFALLGGPSLLVHLGFPARRLPRLRMLNLCLLLVILITLEELSQIFFSERTFSLADLSANYAGILLFGELGYYFRTVHLKDRRI